MAVYVCNFARLSSFGSGTTDRTGDVKKNIDLFLRDLVSAEVEHQVF